MSLKVGVCGGWEGEWEAGVITGGEGLRKLAGQENIALQVYCPLTFPER